MDAGWPLTLELSPDGPRFLAIARAVVEGVRRGRLTPGQQLPGSRSLARQLGVHRNTVLAALEELEAQGWLTTSPARGTFLSSHLPEVETPARGAPGLGALGVDLPPGLALSRDYEPVPRGVLALSSGAPDPALVPVDALARAWRRVVKRRGHRLLEYGHPAGEPRLRAALAELVSRVRGVPARAEHVLVTRGSQMALDLCARTLLSPGDLVAVERLGYRPAWEALTLAGARLAPLAVDERGLDVEAVARLARGGRLRAVYLTPHHQYPTTVSLAPERRLQLLALARAHRFAILEDDYDHEFHYQGRPVLPLASADEAGVVVYLGTLSKVLAPGLRLGFLVGPRAFIERATSLRGVMDRQGDHPMEAAVAELLEDGELQRHVRKMRTEYLKRRDVLVPALRAGLGERFDFEVPAGGICLWLKARRAAGFEAWLGRCEAKGVRLVPGRHYAFDGARLAATRVVFSRYPAATLTRAVEAMRW